MFCNLYTSRQREERAMHLLVQVELADHARKLPGALSGGEQQRVAVARTLANQPSIHPSIVVADEPTGNLVSKSSEANFSFFEDLAEESKTTLMVTHNTDLARRVTRTVILTDGEIMDEYPVKIVSGIEVNH